MTQRINEKQNRYQMKTAEYNNSYPLVKDYQTRTFDNTGYKQQSIYCYEQQQKYPQYYNKSDKISGERRDLSRNRKDINFNISEFNDTNSIQRGYDGEHSQNRRENNARHKQLQIKMNNINFINDKIHSLLNMVKKQKYENPSKQKQIIMQRSHSTNKIIQSPTPIKQDKYSPMDYYKSNNKSIQRLKALSTLSPNIDNKRKQQFTANYIHFNNEEQHYETFKTKMSQTPERHKYERNSEKEGNRYGQLISSGKNRSSYSKYSPKYDENEVKLKLNSSQQYQNTQIETKYENNYYKNNRAQLYNPINKRQAPSDKNQTTKLYQQIEVKSNQSYQQQFIHKFTGMKIIDNQLKRIKQIQKKKQEQANQSRYLQNQSKKQSYNVGKLVNRRETVQKSPHKTFEIKVHPVEKDRAQTIKIAQKLSQQIELDIHMKKTIIPFFKNESEQKWRELQGKLIKMGIKLTLVELKHLLQISSKDWTSFDNLDDSIKQRWDLIERFSQSHRFWQNEVRGCSSLRALRNECFNPNQLDQSQKGFLSPQDLINFVNLYCNSSYRAKDVDIIYRRLQLLQGSTKPFGIDFSTFTRAFAI